MKSNLLAILLMMSPLVSMAQNNWVMPQTNKPEETASKVKKAKDNDKKDKDLPYLAGAVPEKDGKVVFSRTFDTNGMPGKQAFDIVYKELENLASGENQTNKSKIAMYNEGKDSIVATFCEWLVFSDKLLVLDRSLFSYLLVANCEDGKVEVTLSRLIYEYGVENDKERFVAEDFITDNKMLAKGGKKLKRVNRKFRVATVDRMNEVLDSIEKAFPGKKNITE